VNTEIGESVDRVGEIKEQAIKPVQVWSRSSGGFISSSASTAHSKLKGRSMKKLVTLLGTVAVCALALTALSGAAIKTTTWTAALSSGQEIPKQVVRDTAAHGLFKATLSGSTLKWRLTYAKLTGPALAAHIHMAARGKAGDVVIGLCGTSTTPTCSNGVHGSATVTTAVMTAFKKHLLYVNVHTDKNKAGEIRGQLSVG
jgi:CHRD domain